MPQRNLINDLEGNWPLNKSYCCPLWTPSPVGAGTNGHKIQRWKLPLAVLKWLMLPNCIRRLVNCQFASISSWFSSSSPWHAICHNIHAISSAIDRQMTGRNDNDLWSAGLYLTSNNTSPKSHSATPAASRQSAASTKIRSELPLITAHQNCLMADRRPLPLPNWHCQGRQKLYWHNCAPVTAESVVSTWR